MLSKREGGALRAALAFPIYAFTSYTYDGAGNRATMTVTEEGESTVTTYEVDELSRLTLETEETAEKATLYRCYYDNNGNLISKVPETLTDDRAAGAPDLSFDSRDGLALYEYNARNQLVRANVWKENGDTNEVEEELVTNTFNAQGYRASKESDGVTTYFAYSGDKIVKELDSDGVTAYNVYGNSLVCRVVGGERIYYLYNGHGDVTLLMSAGGVIQARYYYDAFGQVLEGNLNLPNPYLYSGYYYDHETELYDLRARFCDARIARFLQEDTFLGQSQDPLCLNRYTYCSNNASTILMMDDYRKMDRLKSTSYIPKAGDTIFIQHPDTKHTGIVEYVEFIEEKQADGSIKEKVIIHTIAGNVRVPTDIKGLNHEWGVIRKQYESTNSTILGYGKNGATECDLREYYQQK